MMHWDPQTIKQFDVQGPRYTSYPTAMQFHEEFVREDLVAAIDRSNEKSRPLSLYFHVPFCKQLCYYCACHKVIPTNRDRVRQYFDSLIKEIELKGQMFKENRPVIQLHFGGGTPTFFEDAELTELMYHISQNFNLLDDDRGDYSIEIDPRDAKVERLALLRGLGFNRVSLGVQDFDLKVQEEINRVQPYELVESVVRSLGDFEFNSLNMDLIYGLPFQTEDSFSYAVQKVINLSPDRVSLFNYAHLPMRFRAQAQFREETLPTPQEKLAIFSRSAQAFMNAGYQYIGMDHFALPEDSLALAQSEGRLHRNFQGYTTRPDADLVGFGVSAISQIDNSYSQNIKTLPEYQELIEGSLLPVERGIELTPDDELRRWVITQIICHNRLSYSDFESRFGVAFERYFRAEMVDLKEAESDGLLELSKEGLAVNDRGRQVIRRLCMYFDKYNNVEKNNAERRFSRII